MNKYEEYQLASTAELVHNLYILSFRARTIQQHILFNKTCRNENLIPTYTKYKLPKHISEVETQKIRTKHINLQIRKQYKQLDEKNLRSRMIHDILTQRLHYLELEEVIITARTFRQEIIRKGQRTKDKKIEGLRRSKHNNNNRKEIQSNVSQHHFHPRVTNLSDLVLNEEELKILERGHKMAHPIKPNLALMAIEMDQAARGHEQEADLRNDLITLLRHTEKQKTHFNNNNKNENKNIQNIGKKLKAKDIVVTMADKNAGMILINRKDYIEKTETFFLNNQYIEIKRNPTKTFHDKTKKIIKKHSEFFKENNYNSYFMLPMNPRTPLLYSLIKLHKINKPIRPIISSCDSSTYKLSKFILNFFKDKIQFKPTYTINNRSDLIDSIRQTKLPKTFTLVSFDIENLYSNIPIAETLQLIKNIVNRTFQSNTTTEIINDLLELCTTQNFCRFNNKYYKYQKGLPMGMPLSGLLADIFLDSIESSLLNTPTDINKNIILWRRYVDDVFIIWEGDDMSEIQVFHDIINELHHNIKFTKEIEQNNNIKFLDLDITHNEKGIFFDIYRKPTQTDVIIPYDSHHHHSHKLAAINSYLHRCYNTPLSDTNRNKEIETIKNIAINNKFPPQTINKIIHKYQFRHNRHNATALIPIKDEKNHKYRNITFPGKIAHSIKHIFNKYNINISFKTDNTTKNKLFNAKDKIQKVDKNGVYQLNCGTCNAVYIGETGRRVKERISEHITNKDDHSQFGKHLKFHKHKFNIEENFTLLHEQNKGYKLSLLEHYEITKLINQKPELQCLNAKLYTPKPPLYTYLKNPFPPPTHS